MALLDERIDHHAHALWQAERDRTPLAPLTDTDPTLGVGDAYAIQTANIERHLAEGRLIRGRKVELSSRAMQEMLGVDEPDFGVLLDDMVVEDGDEARVSELCQPRVEAEIAFVLGTDLAGPGVGTSQAMLALAGVMPSLEIIDSRVENWNIKLVDTIADNASSAHTVPARLRAGTVWVNCFFVRDLRAPFGGFKDSGIGREFFTEAKAVVIEI